MQTRRVPGFQFGVGYMYHKSCVGPGRHHDSLMPFEWKSMASPRDAMSAIVDLCVVFCEEGRTENALLDYRKVVWYDMK